jgi:hypothetical protein
MKHDTNGQILGNATTVIPTRVERSHGGAGAIPRNPYFADFVLCGAR